MATSSTTPASTPTQLGYSNFFEWELATTKDLAGAGVLYHALTDVEMPATAQDQRQWRKERQECVKIITNSLTNPLFIRYRANGC